MNVIIAILGILLVLLALVDGFEAMVLPRRVGRKFRFSLLLYRALWPLWRGIASRIRENKQRHTFLSIFGPYSLLLLFATWAMALITGFAMVNWAIGSKLAGAASQGFFSYLYLSGVTFFTLGFGDVTPAETLGRVVTVSESGIGFGFLAIVIGYMPVLYQAFSRREVSISLLDARAGSPPTSAEILLRLGRTGSLGQLDPFLAEWERWSAELLESTISFPSLAYYRSQHDNQSWLGALTAILDTCALAMSSESGTNSYQAQVTFAMARHAAVDICLVLNAAPIVSLDDRMQDRPCERLIDVLTKTGLDIDHEAGLSKLKNLRDMYEPYVCGLAAKLLVSLPPIAHQSQLTDNWQSSAWSRKVKGLDLHDRGSSTSAAPPASFRESDHFD